MLFDLNPISNLADELLASPLPSLEELLRVPVTNDRSATSVRASDSFTTRGSPSVRSATNSAHQTLQELHSLISRLGSLAGKVEACHAVLTNSQNIVVQLPEEILTDILLRAVDDDSRTSRTRLTHVCARWRFVGVGLPQLWSTICVYTSDLDNLPYAPVIPLLDIVPVKAFFDRSAAVTVDLRIHLHGGSNVKLEISKALASRLDHLRLPQMIKLPIIFETGAKLRLKSFFPYWRRPYSENDTAMCALLDILEAEQIWTGSLDLLDIANLSEQSIKGALHTLVFSAPAGRVLGNGRIIFDKTRTWRVEDIACSPYWRHLCRAIVCPFLETVIIRGTPGIDTQPSSCAPWAEAFLRLFSNSPQLKAMSLGLPAPCIDVIIRTLLGKPALGQRLRAPRLEELSLYLVDEQRASAIKLGGVIRQVVAERKASQVATSIETLRVSRYFLRTDAYSVEMGVDERWLRENVSQFELLD